jgi:hypothetical protein
MAAGVALIIASAMPLRGIADVRVDIARLIALEDEAANAYQSAVEQFRKGGKPAAALTDMIVYTILPELDALQSHLNAVDRVPPLHQSLLADAREYLRLRIESWQLRADGLRTAENAASDPDRMRAKTQYRASTITLSRAEEAERASLRVLQRVRQHDAMAPGGMVKSFPPNGGQH